MSGHGERRQAEGILRLLLAGANPVDTIRDVGWTGLASLAARHGVLLRVADRLSSAGEAGPRWYQETVHQERQRVHASLNIVRRVSAACDEQGIEFIFPKAFQHLPDIGADLDLLLASNAPAVDVRLLETAGIRVRRRIINRLTGSTVYQIDRCQSPLDVQHGRLGRMGEHTTFPAMIHASAHRQILDGTEIRVPSAEHQLILQGMQRIFGRADVRLSDLVYTITSLRRDVLDWGQILATARHLRVFEGLACYLSYVEQVHDQVLGGPLLTPAVRATVHLPRWGRLEFRQGSYRFPVVRVNGALYFAKLVAEVRGHNWSSAGRLCLAPAVAVAGVVRRALGTGVWSNTPNGASQPPATRHLNSLS
jgi:hypothetical protein